MRPPRTLGAVFMHVHVDPHTNHAGLTQWYVPRVRLGYCNPACLRHVREVTLCMPCSLLYVASRTYTCVLKATAEAGVHEHCSGTGSPSPGPMSSMSPSRTRARGFALIAAGMRHRRALLPNPAPGATKSSGRFHLKLEERVAAACTAVRSVTERSDAYYCQTD